MFIRTNCCSCRYFSSQFIFIITPPGHRHLALVRRLARYYTRVPLAVHYFHSVLFALYLMEITAVWFIDRGHTVWTSWDNIYQYDGNKCCSTRKTHLFYFVSETIRFTAVISNNVEITQLYRLQLLGVQRLVWQTPRWEVIGFFV